MLKKTNKNRMVGSAFNSRDWTIESLTERDEKQSVASHTPTKLKQTKNYSSINLNDSLLVEITI